MWGSPRVQRCGRKVRFVSKGSSVGSRVGEHLLWKMRSGLQRGDSMQSPEFFFYKGFVARIKTVAGYCGI